MQISGLSGGAAAITQMRERMFARADADRSGGLSVEEFISAGRRGPAGATGVTADSASRPSDSAIRDAFNGIDSNGDGQLSAAELAAAKPPRPPSGSLGPDNFNTLLQSQGQDGRSTDDTVRRHRPSRGSNETSDAGMQRMLAAYRDRQLKASATGVTA